MALAAGTRLGPYEVHSLIGAGGMGEVYKARDTQLKRDVALKILPADLALEPERLARFDREAQALAALNHPHIAQVYGFAREGAVRGIVMELVEGPTLAERIAHGPLPLDEALPLAIQLADALEYAHEHGIVHRDLKPANIKLTPDGSVKVLDFGLAKVLAGDGTSSQADLLGDSPTMTSPAMSRVGVILGTAAYMAPEQARGTAVDKRADIWAFGVVLFEMLTGKACFTGETVTDVLAAVVKGEPEWHALPATIPWRIRELLEGCLAKDRKARVHDIGDARLELGRAHGAEDEAPAWAMAKVAANRRSWRRATAGVLSLAVLAFGVGAATMLSIRRDGVNLDRYRLTPFATDAEAEQSPAWSPDGKNIAYTKTLEGRAQLFVRKLDVDAPTQITTPMSVSDPMWAPDGVRIFFRSGGNLWSISRAGGEPDLVQKEVRAASLSPDGRTLALWRTTTDQTGGTLATVWIASPPSAPPRPYVPAPFAVRRATTPNYVRFSPDGKAIAVVFYDATTRPVIWVLPFPDGSGVSPRQHFVRLTDEWTSPKPPAWTSDGRHLLIAYGGALVLGDIEDDSVQTLLTCPVPVAAPAVGPGDEQLAFVCGGTDFDVVEIPLDGSPLKPVIATSQNENGPVWIPHSDSFVYVATRQSRMQIRVHDRTTGSDRAVVTPDDFGGRLSRALQALAPSPDATRVAYNGPGGCSISPIGGGTPVKANCGGNVMWSPDGKWLAYTDRERGQLVRARVGSSEADLVLTAKRTFRSAPTVTGGTAVRPVWSPTGGSIAFQEPDGIWLVSDQGGNERLLVPLKAKVMGWSIDGSSIYAIPEGESRDRLVAIDIKSGATRTVSTLEAGVRVAADSTSSAILSPSADGKSLLTSVERTKTDIWLLDGLDTGRGWLHRSWW